MKTKNAVIALLLLSIFHFQSSTALAAAGNLDPAFGGTGKVRIGFGGGFSTARAVVVQFDGKLILAGSGNGQYPSGSDDFLIARFDTNNVLDQTFGERGRVFTHVSTNNANQSSTIQVVRQQADGKIVAAGYAFQNPNYPSFALVRYNTNGSLDTTFGTNGTGIVFRDFGIQAQIAAMQIQSDGKIVVAGFVDNINGTSGFGLARYDTNGVLDPSFGSSGIVITTSANGYTAAHALMIESDGKLVAVGSGIGAGNAGVDFAMFRYTTNGVLDSTFGGGTGQVFTRVSPTAFDYTDTAAGVATQFGNNTLSNPDKIVVAGTYDNENVSPNQTYLTVLRYNLDGTLDSSFGNNGILTNALTTWSGFVSGVTVQGIVTQPRKITVAGYVDDRTNIYYFADRFNSAGALDSTYGTNSSGTVTLPIGRDIDNVESAAYAMALQGGQVVLAGYRAIFEGESDFAAGRFTTSGLVDTNFGSNGLLLANLADAPSQANAVAIQNDGKIVVGGGAESGGYNPSERFALARFNADGSLDLSFGLNGTVTTIINTNEHIYSLAMKSDGKIIAGGSSLGMFALARYNPNGSLDNSFGASGTTTTQVGTGSDQVNALEIQSDGKIVAAGSAYDGSGNQHFALARYDTNGILDTTFGSAGKVVTAISTADIAYGAGLQTNGKMVLAGVSVSVNGSSLAANFAVTRYNTNGTADFSFGSLGRAQGNVGSGTLDAGYAMAIQPDGKIVVAGGAGVGNVPGPASGNQSVNSFLALLRFNTNGTPDTSFGNNGSVITEVGAYSDFATSLVLQPDGKILVAGGSQNGFYKMFALRYNSDGTVDGSYGNSGATVVDFGSITNECAYGLALDSFGRAVVAGDAGGTFGIARLQGDFAVTPPLKIFLTTSNTLVVSWPYPSTGWNLEQNAILNAGSWSVPPQTLSNDGTNNFIVINPVPGTGNIFYRLSNP